MSKHTPGPWRRCGGETPAYAAIHSSDGYIVFRMADWMSDQEKGIPIRAPSYDVQRANVRLIAAAPDLLEALQAMTDYLAETTGQVPKSDAEGLVNRGRAALAKATGEPL